MASNMDWVPEEELELLKNAPPPSVVTKESAEKIAMAIFRDNAALCAEIICDIAVNSENEKTRLTASKYVVERVLGRTPEAAPTDATLGAYDDLFGSVIREPNASERAEGARVSRI